MNPAKFQQQRDYTCGSGCVRMLLDHYGIRVPSERALSRKLFATNARGIEPWRIALYMGSRGFNAESCSGETVGKLRKRLDSGWMAIICWADWGGHYCVVWEMDAKKDGSLILADPAASYDCRPDGFTKTTIERFKSMWFDPIGGQKGNAIYIKEK